MSITNATNLRKNLFAYLDDATVNDDPVVVTTKNGNAVIISEDTFKSLQETCFLFSIPGMKESIEEGVNTPVDDCVELDWRNMLK